MFTLPDGNLKFYVYRDSESGESLGLLAAFKTLDDAQNFVSSKHYACSIWQAHGDDAPAVKVQ